MIFPFPPKTIFPNSAPRYPNLWILVSEHLADNYCPICGCVGEHQHYYDAAYHNRASTHKNEMLHDPLGLEAILFGTINNTPIPLFRGLSMSESRYRMEIHHFESPREDINTKNAGVVVFHSPK
jgi:hypothetical protein